MSDSSAERRAIAQLAFENAGREITQVFEVMNSNMSLAAGALAALLAVLGAGELFSQARALPGQVSPEHFPRLSAVSLVVLSAAAPLIARFFVRSMTAYQNLVRFLGIQNIAWRFLIGSLAWEAFSFHVELYWTRWKTPEPMRKVALSNLKYGFMWIAFITAVALGWAFWSVDDLAARLVAAAILILGLGWEAITLIGYRQRYFQLPDKVDIDRLKELLADGTKPGDSKEAAAVLEQASGLFIGKRRLFGRSPDS